MGVFYFEWVLLILLPFHCDITGARQPPEVWQAFNKLVIPHSTRELVRDNLWLKLKVGDRLKGWLPHQCMCPLCQEVETMAHPFYGCQFLRLSVETILRCYGDMFQPPYTAPFRMSLTQHSVTLTTPQGIFLWSATHANWKVHCQHRHTNTAPTTHIFVTAWYRLSRPWASFNGFSF